MYACIMLAYRAGHSTEPLLALASSSGDVVLVTLNLQDTAVS